LAIELTDFIADGEVFRRNGDLIDGQKSPEVRRFALSQRAQAMAFAAVASGNVRELWIGDSLSSYGASDPGTTDLVHLYEQGVADAYHPLPATEGFVPFDLWTSLTGSVITWDTIPAGQRTTRGPANSNKYLTTGQSFTHAGFGTAVTIFYTEQGTSGAVADVIINGTTVGTIDTRAGGAGTYNSGNFQSFNRGGTGPMTVTITHNGTGTNWEGTGAFFHHGASTTGHILCRGDLPGQALSNLVGAAGTPVLETVANWQPQIVTISLGTNDGQAGRTSTQVAADLVTLVTSIRAQYTGGLVPAVRYLFPNDGGTLTSTWATTYRRAVRAACVANDILFMDGYDAVGSIDGSDPLDFSDDGLHPNDKGSRAYADLVLEHTVRFPNPRRIPLLLGASTIQRSTGGIIRVSHENGIALLLLRDEGIAANTSDALGYVGYQGAVDDFGNPDTGAAVKGVADGNWSDTSSPGRLEFMTTPAGSLGASIAVRAGVSNAGTLFVGPTLGAAVTSIDAGGLLRRVRSTMTLANGANANEPLPASSFVSITGPTGAFSLSGIVASDGASLRIVNLTGEVMTVTHEATSTAANRLTTLTGADLVSTGNCAFDVDYDTGTSRWIVTNWQA
jgi:hypothetical protein